MIAKWQPVELRTLGRAAAEIDQGLALDAEAPKVQLGRSRGTRKPMFLFPTAETASEIEWQAQSTMRYHGRVADLAVEVVRARDNARTTLFVMPTLGVAERLTEILGEYDVETRLALIAQPLETSDSSTAIVTVGRFSGGLSAAPSQFVVYVRAGQFDEYHVDLRGR